VSVEGEKRHAAEAAAELVEDGMAVGLGTGSTVAYFLPALALRGLRIRCVATSLRTESAARELGLPVEPFEELDRLDLAVDGADQIDPAGWLVKGGGAAHTREKIVAAAADRFRSGDARTVISPSRLDEIGAIAICLDICRQAHVDGAGRLGGVVRMRGAGSDHTAVISRIPAERPASTPEPNESTGHATAALVDNKNAPQARHPYFERS